MIAALGIALLGIGILFLWGAVTNRNPVDELLITFGARHEDSRPINS